LTTNCVINTKLSFRYRGHLKPVCNGHHRDW